MAITLFFISKLFLELAAAVFHSWHELREDLLKAFKAREELSVKTLMIIGTLISLFSFSLWMGYQFQQIVRLDVLDRESQGNYDIYTPRQLWATQQVADFLTQSIDKSAVVETWERELGVFTHHNYHYPDSLLLAKADAAIYYSKPVDYQLGDAYFSSISAAITLFWQRFRGTPIRRGRRFLVLAG